MKDRELLQFPIGESILDKGRLDSLRIKVTDKCQWQCAFCHNEGNVATADLKWGPDTEEAFTALQEALPSIKKIHYTGGEPTTDPELAAVTAGLSSLGFEVKTTTNGQFDLKILNKLIEAGLKSFNFSVHSLDPERFLKFQLGRGVWWEEKKKRSGKILPLSSVKRKKIDKIEWAKQQINRQLEMITATREKGVDVKMNSVISSDSDIENAQEIFQWARENGIPLRLLNDLGNGMDSIDAIRKFIKQTGAREVLRKVSEGSSACSTVYRTDDGYEFAFKQIRDYKLETMCRTCPRAEDGTCEEQFYGIRLQKGKDGKFYVLLCVQESQPETQMPLEDFLESPQLKEIQKLLET